MDNLNDFNSLNGKELADLLDVSPASLSGAAKKDHLCKGEPVAEWAVRNERGKLLSYEVPGDVYSTLIESTKNEPNKVPNQPNTSNKPENDLIKEIPGVPKKELNKPNEPPVEVQEIRPNLSTVEASNVTWAGAFTVLAVAAGAVYMGNYIQNENKALRIQNTTLKHQANKANKTKRKQGGFVWN
jgi:hypothetical protein